MRYSLRHSIKWSIFIFFLTFVLAAVFSVASTIILEGVTWGFGMLTVLCLILVGIVFDIMGLASASAVETPFHAMASEKVKGAKQAIQIVRNADRFSNFCNDVIGDIAGIISGAASALVVIKLLMQVGLEHPIWSTAVSVVFSALVSALTVGGKSLGKSFAIHNSTTIVLVIGKLFHTLDASFGIRLFGPNKQSNGKRGKKRAARNGKSA